MLTLNERIVAKPFNVTVIWLNNGFRAIFSKRFKSCATIVYKRRIIRMDAIIIKAGNIRYQCAMDTIIVTPNNETIN